MQPWVSSMQCTCTIFSCYLYYVFPHYLIQGTIFREKFTSHKMYVLFIRTDGQIITEGRTDGLTGRHDEDIFLIFVVPNAPKNCIRFSRTVQFLLLFNRIIIYKRPRSFFFCLSPKIVRFVKDIRQSCWQTLLMACGRYIHRNISQLNSITVNRFCSLGRLQSTS